MSLQWVCPECGLDYGTISPQDAVRAVRSFPRRYRAVLKGFEDDDGDPDAVIRRRPDPKTWSGLEYTAHVADVFDAMEPMLREMVQKDNPRIVDPWDPDERAVAARYDARTTSEVLDWLDRSAERMAATLESFSPDDWKRTEPSTASTSTTPRRWGGSSAEYKRMRQTGRLRRPLQPSWAEAWPTGKPTLRTAATRASVSRTRRGQAAARW